MMNDHIERTPINRNNPIPHEIRALPTQMLRTLSASYPTAYLVGGALRNLLLGQPCVDWDIVVSAKGHALSQSARELAHALGGFYVHLHEKADRVIVKGSDQETIIDLAPMDGPTIEADLARRDFTINAIAIPLHVFNTWLTTTMDSDFTLASEQLSSLCIDPYHGIADSIARRLYTVSDSIFVQDPLRMLRALRLATRYHLTIDPATSQLIQHDAHLLSHVASERIYPELASILEPPGTAQRLHLLDDLHLLTEIFPELIPMRDLPQPPAQYQDIFNHACETVFMLEQLASLFATNPFPSSAQHFLSSIDTSTSGMLLDASEITEFQTIHTLLQEAQHQGIFDLANLSQPALKLAALLHDVGKSATYTIDENNSITFPGHEQAGRSITNRISQRLHLPSQERHLIELVIMNHSRPFQLAQQQVTPLVMHRYFVALGANGISVALIALAAALATYGSQPRPAQWPRLLTTVRLLFTGYMRNRQQILPPRLLQGDELIQQLGLQPGPVIGQLLSALAEAQVDGQVHTRQEALLFAHHWLQKPH